MSEKYERHLDILNILFTGRRVKCKTLAAEFGVCLKTIKQDLSELSLHYPIITYQGYGGGVEIQKGFVLNGYIMKRKYLELIIEALHQLKKRNDDPDIITLLNTLQQG